MKDNRMFGSTVVRSINPRRETLGFHQLPDLVSVHDAARRRQRHALYRTALFSFIVGILLGLAF